MRNEGTRSVVCSATAAAVALACCLMAATGAQGALVHYYSFDEAGGNALDSVAGNTGVLTGNVLPSRSNDTPNANSVRSMSFSGVNADQSHILFNNTITFTETQPFTASLWYKGPDEGDDSRYGAPLLSTAPGDGSITGNIQIYQDAGSLAGARRGGARLQATNPGNPPGSDNTFFATSNVNSATNNDTFAGGSPVNDDTWHMLTFVSDGNGTGIGDGTARVYVDGVLKDSGLHGDFSSGTLPSARYKSLMAGFSFSTGNDANLNYYTAGLVDDLRIYDNALTQTEIQALLLIPEPMTGSLLAIGGLLLLHRRRSA